MLFLILLNLFPPSLEMVTYPTFTSDSDQAMDNESKNCAQDSRREVDMHHVDGGKYGILRLSLEEAVCRKNSEVLEP